MRYIIFFTLTIFSALNSTSQSSAALGFKKDKGYFSVGINPTYPILAGYGVKVFYNLPMHFSFGIISERVFNLPKNAQKQFFKNTVAIKVNWDYSIGVEARYRFNKKDNDIKGLYAFTTLGYEQWTINKATNVPIIPNTIQKDMIDNWFTSTGVGYNYFPIKNTGLWLGAAYNIIFLLNNTQNKSINNSTYNLRTIVPPSLLPNLYIGWRF
jgi:hypothetical protein